MRAEIQSAVRITWYLESYPDVARAGIEPLGHYLTAGAEQGHATGPLFDTAWYVAAHPEERADARTPLGYFLEASAQPG